MDTDMPIPFPSVLLEVIGAPADMRPRVFVPKSRNSKTPRTPGFSPAGMSRPAPTRLPVLAPPTLRPLRPAPPPLSGLAPPLRIGLTPSAALRAPPAATPPLRRSLGSARARVCLPGDAASPAPSSELRASSELGWLSMSSLRVVGVRETQAGLGCAVPQLPRRRPRSLGPEFCIPEIPGRKYPDKTDAVKVPKNGQYDRLLVFDPKEKVMIEPDEEMSRKEVSLKNNENRVSLKSTGNKDTLTNLQSKLWSSSFLKEGTGTVDKALAIAKQEKNNKYCPQDTNDKLSESTDDDGEHDASDNDDSSNPNKDTHAPLELMAEFLRAEMDRDYHLAKKLCQMILIYEPENPEAKEFFSLIEEVLLMEKTQSLKEDDEDSEEDSSVESEGESTEEPSEESSDECEDG
ncbi:glutamate-rich protein 2 [Trichechus inunguis]